MSVSLMAEAWRMAIPTTEKMVLLCLCDFANDRGECWPSVDTLAGKCSLSDRTVQKAIKQLREWGIIATHDVPGRPHMFTVNPRSSFTPENASPPKMTAKPPKEIHPRGEAASPEPSKNHQEPSEGSPQEADALSVDEIVEGWNTLAGKHGLQRIARLTEERRRKAKAQARRFSVDDWVAVFAKISQSPFLLGQNDRGWRCDFDFILSERNFVKILEGKYDRQPAH